SRRRRGAWGAWRRLPSCRGGQPCWTRSGARSPSCAARTSSAAEMLDIAQLEAAGLLDDVEDERTRHERVELLQQLLRDGFSLEELAAGSSPGSAGAAARRARV